MSLSNSSQATFVPKIGFLLGAENDLTLEHGAWQRVRRRFAEASSISIPRSGLTKTALLIAVLSVTNAASGTESGDRSAGTEPSPARLLTAQEGRALVGRALDQPMTSDKPDCSHLVHQIFSDAGLNYSYATSFEIFAGIPQFRRIRHAQPGDLIVWPGHVGLVVNPKQTTFFSSTTSGPRTDEYSSDYWRHRGYARFYRYLVTDTTQLAAHRLREEHGLKPSHRGQATASLEASRITPTTEPSDAPEPSSEAAATPEPTPDDPSVSSQNREFPETIPIDSDNGRPTKGDIEQAISQLTNVSASALENANRKSMSVVFVRCWKIEKMNLTDDEGWVQLRVKPSGERSPDGTWKKLRVLKLHYDLRRDQTGWLLFPPHDRLYVSTQSR